jgi:predicted deacetylase
VLSQDVVATNWDQGQLTEADLHAVIDLLRARVVACDVTGDISSYRYRSRFKRWLSARDAQPSVGAVTLAAAQARHAQINANLLRCLWR